MIGDTPLAGNGLAVVHDADGNNIGTLVNAFETKEYAAAVRAVMQMIEGNPTMRQRCRALAQEKFSMRAIGQPAYVSVYRELETAKVR